MTAAHGDLRTSRAAQRAHNTRLDTSLTSANDDAAAHFDLSNIDLREQQMIYNQLNSKPAADPLVSGQATMSDDSAPQYVNDAINAAIDEQFESEDHDPERMDGLASVIAALSTRTSPRYSALLTILKRGNEKSVDMKKLLTMCIRTLKAN